MKKNKVIILKDLPKFALNSACFTTTDRPVKEPIPGEVLIKVKLISIDAANRAWLNGPTYRPAIYAGDIMPAYGIGEVVKSRSKNLKKGDLVSGELEWSEYTTKVASFLKKVDGGPARSRKKFRSGNFTENSVIYNRPPENWSGAKRIKEF